MSETYPIGEIAGDWPLSSQMDIVASRSYVRSPAPVWN